MRSYYGGQPDQRNKSWLMDWLSRRGVNGVVAETAALIGESSSRQYANAPHGADPLKTLELLRMAGLPISRLQVDLWPDEIVTLAGRSGSDSLAASQLGETLLQVAGIWRDQQAMRPPDERVARLPVHVRAPFDIVQAQYGGTIKPSEYIRIHRLVAGAVDEHLRQLW
jgi:hypothetical protein